MSTKEKFDTLRNDPRAKLSESRGSSTLPPFPSQGAGCRTSLASPPGGMVIARAPSSEQWKQSDPPTPELFKKFGYWWKMKFAEYNQLMCTMWEEDLKCMDEKVMQVYGRHVLGSFSDTEETAKQKQKEMAEAAQRSHDRWLLRRRKVYATQTGKNMADITKDEESIIDPPPPVDPDERQSILDMFAFIRLGTDPATIETVTTPHLAQIASRSSTSLASLPAGSIRFAPVMEMIVVTDEVVRGEIPEEIVISVDEDTNTMTFESKGQPFNVQVTNGTEKHPDRILISSRPYVFLDLTRYDPLTESASSLSRVLKTGVHFITSGSTMVNKADGSTENPAKVKYQELQAAGHLDMKHKHILRGRPGRTVPRMLITDFEFIGAPSSCIVRINRTLISGVVTSTICPSK